MKIQFIDEKQIPTLFFGDPRLIVLDIMEDILKKEPERILGKERCSFLILESKKNKHLRTSVYNFLVRELQWAKIDLSVDLPDSFVVDKFCADFIQDLDIGIDGIGLLGIASEKFPEREFCFTHLFKCAKGGRLKIRKILDKLIHFGYVMPVTPTKPKKPSVTYYVFYDSRLTEQEKIDFLKPNREFIYQDGEDNDSHERYIKWSRKWERYMKLKGYNVNA